MTPNSADEIAKNIVEFRIGDCACEDGYACVPCKLVSDVSEAVEKAHKQGFKDGIKNKCQLIRECKRQWLEWMFDMIENDALAITFQSMGQYRKVLLRAIAKELEDTHAK